MVPREEVQNNFNLEKQDDFSGKQPGSKSSLFLSSSSYSYHHHQQHQLLSFCNPGHITRTTKRCTHTFIALKWQFPFFHLSHHHIIKGIGNKLKKIFIIIITIGIILIIWQTAVARKLGVNVLRVVKLAHTNCHFHHNQRKRHYHHHLQQLQDVTGLAAVSV